MRKIARGVTAPSNIAWRCIEKENGKRRKDFKGKKRII